MHQTQVAPLEGQTPCKAGEREQCSANITQQQAHRPTLITPDWHAMKAGGSPKRAEHLARHVAGTCSQHHTAVQTHTLPLMTHSVPCTGGVWQPKEGTIAGLSGIWVQSSVEQNACTQLTHKHALPWQLSAVQGLTHARSSCGQAMNGAPIFMRPSHDGAVGSTFQVGQPAFPAELARLQRACTRSEGQNKGKADS
jgi:hypothetical protein